MTIISRYSFQNRISIVSNKKYSGCHRQSGARYHKRWSGLKSSSHTVCISIVVSVCFGCSLCRWLKNPVFGLGQFMNFKIWLLSRFLYVDRFSNSKSLAEKKPKSKNDISRILKYPTLYSVCTYSGKDNTIEKSLSKRMCPRTIIIIILLWHFKRFSYTGSYKDGLKNRCFFYKTSFSVPRQKNMLKILCNFLVLWIKPINAVFFFLSKKMADPGWHKHIAALSWSTSFRKFEISNEWNE